MTPRLAQRLYVITASQSLLLQHLPYVQGLQLYQHSRCRMFEIYRCVHMQMINVNVSSRHWCVVSSNDCDPEHVRSSRLLQLQNAPRSRHTTGTVPFLRGMVPQVLLGIPDNVFRDIKMLPVNCCNYNINKM